MLYQPLIAEEQNKDEAVQGLSDLLFEVLSGQGEDLHSKAREILNELLKCPELLKENNTKLRRCIRFLYLKLLNEIDFKK